MVFSSREASDIRDLEGKGRGARRWVRVNCRQPIAESRQRPGVQSSGIMCIPAHAHTHLHMHMHMHTCTYTSIHWGSHLHTHTCTCTHTHTHTCTCTPIHIRTQAHACMTMEGPSWGPSWESTSHIVAQQRIRWSCTLGRWSPRIHGDSGFWVQARTTRTVSVPQCIQCSPAFGCPCRALCSLVSKQGQVSAQELSMQWSRCEQTLFTWRQCPSSGQEGEDDWWRMFVASARASVTKHVLPNAAEYPARTHVHQVPTSLVLDGPRLSWEWESQKVGAWNGAQGDVRSCDRGAALCSAFEVCTESQWIMHLKWLGCFPLPLSTCAYLGWWQFWLYNMFALLNKDEIDKHNASKVWVYTWLILKVEF